MRAFEGSPMSLPGQSSLFAAAWNQQGVQHGEAGGLREFVHPNEGPLSFEQHTFHPAERRDYKLVVLVRSPPRG